MKNRFDFEELMMQCWHVTDDIDTIKNYAGECNMRPLEQDVLLNMLIGVREVYNQRFAHLTEMFSTMVQRGAVTNKDF
jgi:hypothetical protein